jgi:hypothetical protein
MSIERWATFLAGGVVGAMLTAVVGVVWFDVSGVYDAYLEAQKAKGTWSVTTGGGEEPRTVIPQVTTTTVEYAPPPVVRAYCVNWDKSGR